jgi:acyl-[acyl-carrier-protein] desaturase
MRLIASDENHHFIFYKGVMTALVKVAPSLALEGMYKALSSFEMPGTVIPGFLRRSIEIAKAGVYNLRIHHDRVLQPLLRDWNVGALENLTAKAAEIQEKLMQLPHQIMTRAERFEARFA